MNNAISNPKNIFFFLLACNVEDKHNTAIKASSELKKKYSHNISFIGSNFYPLEVPQGQDFYGPDGIALYNAFEKNYFLAKTNRNFLIYW